MFRRILNHIKSKLLPEDIEIAIGIILLAVCIWILWPLFQTFWIIFIG